MSFTNYAWNSYAFDPGEQFIGDYNGIAALGGRVYGVWARTPEAEENTDIPKPKKVSNYVEAGSATFTK
jgi:hypothetical protein